MSSIYNKYLKYKTKYLQLINSNDMIGGGDDELTNTMNVIEAQHLDNNMIGGGDDELVNAMNVIEAQHFDNDMIGGGDDLIYAQNIVEAHPLISNMVGGGDELEYAMNVVEAHHIDNNMIGGGDDLIYAQNIVEAHPLTSNLLTSNPITSNISSERLKEMEEPEHNTSSEAIAEHVIRLQHAHPKRTEEEEQLFHETEELLEKEKVLHNLNSE